MQPPDVFDAQAAEEQQEPGEVKCRFCGSTDVYWMTCMKRKEAEWLARNGTPRALHLAQARLYNLSGGEHNCRGPASADEFDAV